MNYRIDQRRDAVLSNIRSGDLQYLLTHDQLLKELKTNRGFRLRSFMEPPITFAPTYKYNRFSDEYDNSEKKRIPAWCDRILYRCRDPQRVEVLHYRRYEVNISDHRPVSAGLAVRVKRVDHDARQAVVADVSAQWTLVQKGLIANTKEFCLRVGLL